jgi:hypothetical protein
VKTSLHIIHTPDGFRTIEAAPFTCLFASLILHPSLCGEKWTASEVRSGRVIAHGGTPDSAKAAARERLAKVDPARFDALVATQEIPAGVNAPFLPLTSPAPVEVADPIETVLDVCERHGVDLSAGELDACRRAFATKGKAAGRLRLSPPQGAFGSKADTLANAAWNALQPNPHKVQIGNSFFWKADERALFDKLAKLPWPAAFDLDAHQLKRAGVW